MKKLYALIMCLALVLVTGCSGVSRDEYDALAAENSRLESEYERILMEKNNLANELSETKVKNKATTECFKISNETLGKPETAIAEKYSKTFEGGISDDTCFYLEKATRSAKSIITFNRSLELSEVAEKIKFYNDENSEAVKNIMSNSALKSNIFIYRFDDGEVIMSNYWYKDNGGIVQECQFWFSKDVAEEHDKLE